MLLTVFENLGESFISQILLPPNLLLVSQGTHREPDAEKNNQTCFNLKTISKSPSFLIPKPPLVFGLQMSDQETLAPEAEVVLFFHRKPEHRESNLA